MSPATPRRILFLSVSASRFKSLTGERIALIFASRQTNGSGSVRDAGRRVGRRADRAAPRPRPSHINRLAPHTHLAPPIHLLIFATHLRMNEQGGSFQRAEAKKMSLGKSPNLWPYRAAAVTWPGTALFLMASYSVCWVACQTGQEC